LTSQSSKILACFGSMVPVELNCNLAHGSL
jgi:hypothetical protein